MRRTIMRGLVLVGVGTLGLMGMGAAAGGATGGDHTCPDPGHWYGFSPGTAFPSLPDVTPTMPSLPGTRLPGHMPVVTTSKAKPKPARVRLHTTLTGAHVSSLARSTLRVRAEGGVAHRVRATIAIHPSRARFAAPGACHGGARVHCRLGDVHGARLLTFRERPGHAAHRITITATVTAANAPAERNTMVLVVRTAPAHTVRESVPRHVPPEPRYVPPETVTRHELRTVQRPAPPATIFSTPAGVQEPLNPGAPAARPKPRLPVIAPRPGPRPTPNGAPVTVRPVADGHAITGAASGMPTRTILGVLAAAASFVGLVTALVLIRRRDEA